MEQFLDVLPSGGVFGPGRIVIGQSINEHHLRMTIFNGSEIHGQAISTAAHWDDFEFSEKVMNVGGGLRLNRPYHDVFAARASPPSLVEHLNGLADPRSVTE